MADQNEDEELKNEFASVAESLCLNEEKIVSELMEVQCSPVDVGGYYRPDDEKVTTAMRPSQIFNDIIDQI